MTEMREWTVLAPARIYSITRNDSDITIYWHAVAGVSYVVQWSENMADWTNVSVGQVSEWTDVGGAANGQSRFYRVAQE